MSSKHVSRIFVIGATGAQGILVVRALVSDGNYSVLALSRDAQSSRAKSLLELGGVSILEEPLQMKPR